MRNGLAVILCVTMLLAAAGCGLLSMRDSDDAVQPMPVVVATARVETLHPSSEVLGQVVEMPERSAMIYAQQPGVVTNVPVVEGERVTKGQRLTEMDSRIAAAERDKAQAALDAAKAACAQLQIGTRPEEVDAARNELSEAVADVTAKRAKLDALQPLLERHELPDVRGQQAGSDLQAAQAKADGARARLKMLEAGFRAEAVAETEARMREAQAELELRELAVTLCVIVSPMEGVVAQLPIRLGTALDTQTLVATVMDMSEVFVQMRLPAGDVARLDAAQPAQITPVGGGEAGIQGMFERAAHVADPLTGDTELFLRVPNPGGQLRPGQACQCQIWFTAVENAVTVPIAALSDTDGASVVTVIRDNKAYEIPVTRGARTNENVQIVEGLTAGEIVAVQNGYGLPEGFPVTPTQ